MFRRVERKTSLWEIPTRRNPSANLRPLGTVAKGGLVAYALISVGIGLFTTQHSLCGSSVNNDHRVVNYNRSSAENYFDGLLPPDVCHRLNEHNLHRRHAPSTTTQLARLDKKYALNTDALRTGLVIGGSQRRLQPALLRKIANHEHVTILTLGSSFTRGHGCGETELQNELECAWPSRLERWWQTHFMPGVANSTFVHHAEHGATSVVALQRIGVIVGGMAPVKPDLILVDFLVTDVAGGDIGTIGYESLLRTIIELLPDAQLMLFEAGCRNCIGNHYVLHRRRQIARQYDIPVVDFAAMVEAHNHPGRNNPDNSPDVLWPTEDPPLKGPYIELGIRWPNFEPEVNTTKTVCCPNNHPPWPVHQYVSDAVAFALIQMLKDQGGCGNQQEKRDIDNHSAVKSFHTKGELEKYPSCTHPLVWHDALAPDNGGHVDGKSDIGNPISADGNWKLYEDKPGRPGWITTTRGSVITFPIRFSRVRPILAITYLRSYANIGDALVTFTSHSGKTSAVRLEGHWTKNFSLPHTAFFIERPDGVNGNLLGDAIESDGYKIYELGNDIEDKKKTEDYTIDITLTKGEKFKVIQVISC